MKNKVKVFGILSACIVGAFLLITSQSPASAQAESKMNVGFRLMVDGTSWGVAEDKGQLQQVIEDYKKSTLTDVEGEVTIESAETTQLIEIVEIEFEGDDFTSIEAIREKIQADEISEVAYTVKSGDSVWAIAQKNKIPVATILQLNPGLDSENIHAGQQIVFQTKDPVIDVVANVQSTIVEPIQYATEYVNDSTLAKGKQVVVKKGVPGSKKITFDLQLVNGYVESKEIVKEEQMTAPVNAVVKVGTKVTVVQKTTSTYNRTVRNYGVVTGRLSSDYGYRNDPFTGLRTFHTGIDISAPYGTPVYAYAGGTVVVSTSNSIRGNYITIDHGNGLQTSYLHLSSRLVKVGDVVSSRQLIGKVGSTGSATGNHLHFTVTKNGTLVSPWNYV
ncbi:MAG: peptidoglycan DD-metalloendopeptidase family protein [Erysipelotrichaceae bacterium]